MDVQVNEHSFLCRTKLMICIVSAESVDALAVINSFRFTNKCLCLHGLLRRTDICRFKQRRGCVFVGWQPLPNLHTSFHCRYSKSKDQQQRRFTDIFRRPMWNTEYDRFCFA